MGRMLIWCILLDVASVAKENLEGADAHVNSFVRLKLVLTEERPTLKPYDQTEWAKTPDATHSSIQSSLAILKGLQER